MEKNILFVDDEEGILKVLAGLFRSHGFSPRCAASGQEALELIRKECFPVCFLDLQMPDMDGMELCRRVKQLNPDACVYALSAFIDDFDPLQFRKAGFDGFFHKPFKIDALLNAGREAFARLEAREKGKAP